MALRPLIWAQPLKPGFHRDGVLAEVSTAEGIASTGAGADKAHLAAQDVEQLGKLIH